MSQSFEATYFDGKSFQPRPARVSLEPGALRIAYKTQQNTLPVTLYWQIHRIQKENSQPAGKVVLRYGANPTQVLEIVSPDFLKKMEAYYAPELSPARAYNSPKVTTSPKGLSWIWAGLLLILTLIPLTYFWVLPAVADFAARRVPAAYERRIGKELYKTIIATEAVDETKTTYLQGFIRQFHLPSAYPIDVTVIKNEVPNAFAVPGGNIVVHTGVIKLTKSPAELAALLAHEYSHLKLRHSIRTLFRSLSGYLFISLLFGDVSGITAVLIENGQSLKSLQYSRKLETEADVLGLQILLQNKTDPHGMIRLFEHLKQATKEKQTDFLSTHPALTSRKAHIQKLLKNRPRPVVSNDSVIYFWQKLQQ